MHCGHKDHYFALRH